MKNNRQATFAQKQDPLSFPELRETFQDRVITPTDSGYDQARSLFYGGMDRHPVAIVRPADVAEVSRIVSFARVAGLEIDGAPFFVGEPEHNGWISPAEIGTTTVRVELFCDDPDAVIQRALTAGAAGRMEDIHDYQMPWGIHRQGRFIDPFGHLWLAGNISPLSRFPLETQQPEEGAFS